MQEIFFGGFSDATENNFKRRRNEIKTASNIFILVCKVFSFVIHLGLVNCTHESKLFVYFCCRGIQDRYVSEK